MNEEILPERTILNFLEETSPLAWGRTQTRTDKRMVNGQWIHRDYLKHPPYISFRFEDEDVNLIEIIREALENFKGKVKWGLHSHKRIDLPGTNWSIAPERMWEIKDTALQIPISADKYLAQNEPELGPLAYDDLPRLAERIRNAISEKYKKA